MTIWMLGPFRPWSKPALERSARRVLLHRQRARIMDSRFPEQDPTHEPSYGDLFPAGQLRTDSRTSRIPVLVISADATPRQIARLQLAGARVYLTKPLDVDEFLSEVDAALAI